MTKKRKPAEGNEVPKPCPEAEPEFRSFFHSQPTVEFDGRQFHQFSFTSYPWAYEMAYRARRGDEGAAGVLDAMNLRLYSWDEQPYWPMEEDAEAE